MCSRPCHCLSSGCLLPPRCAVLKKFQHHLRFGGKLELLALTELPDVDEATARLLYNAGRPSTPFFFSSGMHALPR